MTAKTRRCDECEHFDPIEACSRNLPCGLNHKPRFYAQLDNAGRIPGWKRRCEDFNPKESP